MKVPRSWVECEFIEELHAKLNSTYGPDPIGCKCDRAGSLTPRHFSLKRLGSLLRGEEPKKMKGKILEFPKRKSQE